MIVDAIGYLRVSTEDQARDDKTSLADQECAIAAKAVELGVTIGRPFRDEGVSGRTAHRRPGFMEMFRFCEANQRPLRDPGYVVMLNISRFGRFEDPDEFAYWRVQFKNLGWLMRFVEGDESDDPVVGSLVRAVQGTQASAYSINLSTNVRRGVRGTAEQGYWRVEAPFGYRRRVDTNGTPGRILELGERKAENERVRLHPGPEAEQTLVRFIFEQYAAGAYSLGALAREMQQQAPVRKWSKQSIRLILANPAYRGAVVACHGVVVTEDAHPRLVDKNLWYEAQARLATNKKQTRATKGGYPLSGLLTCAQCGSLYRGGGGSKGPPGDEDRYRFYRCSGAVKREPTCDGRIGILQKRFIEPAVIDAVARVVSHPVVYRMIEDEVDQFMEAATDTQRDQRRSLQSERERIARRQRALVRAIANETLTEAEAEAEIADIRTVLARVDDQLGRLRFERRWTNALSLEKQRLVRMARDFGAAIRKLSGAAQRELLRPWLDSAVVDKEKRVVTLTIRRVPAIGPFLQLSPLPGRD